MFNVPSTVTSTRYSPFNDTHVCQEKSPKVLLLIKNNPMWNQLPQDLVNSNSLISFRNKLILHN